MAREGRAATDDAGPTRALATRRDRPPLAWALRLLGWLLWR